jgi:hypothetical protein
LRFTNSTSETVNAAQGTDHGYLMQRTCAILFDKSPSEESRSLDAPRAGGKLGNTLLFGVNLATQWNSRHIRSSCSALGKHRRFLSYSLRGHFNGFTKPSGDFVQQSLPCLSAGKRQNKQDGYVAKHFERAHASGLHKS